MTFVMSACPQETAPTLRATLVFWLKLATEDLHDFDFGLVWLILRATLHNGRNKLLRVSTDSSDIFL
jgi:hypothetical protein